MLRVRRCTGSSSDRRRAGAAWRGSWAQAPGDCGVATSDGRQRHLVEPVQDRRVAVPSDAGDRGRAQVEAPVEVDGPQGPGHGRLDRRHVAHHDDIAVAPAGRAAFSEQLRAGGRDALVHLGQRLASLGPEAAVVLPALPDLGRDAAEGLALELAVVDLHPPLVDGCRDTQAEQLGGVAGPAERARTNLGHGVAHKRPGRRDLRPAELGELGVRAAQQQALRVGHRLAVTNQDQHGVTPGRGSARTARTSPPHRPAGRGSSRPPWRTAGDDTRRSGCR